MPLASVTPTALLILLVLGGTLALGEGEIRIHNASELVSFSEDVNSGTNYSGTTVYLDSDIEFSSSLSQQFEPIGKSIYFYFNGIFDGKGHAISNLTFNSSFQHVGLFGYSEGVNIKNVVMDSSCSFANYYTDFYSTYMSGIVGKCYATKAYCAIENSVNMASVTFYGNTESTLFLGGIAAYFYSSSNWNSTAKNCANYGSLIHFGNSSNSYIGGVNGYYYGGSSEEVRIQNCLNYGSIVHNGITSEKAYIGGISGYGQYTEVENCVSGGKIENSGQAAVANHIGSIVGYIDKATSIIHCFWTSDVGRNAYGSNSSAVTVIESSLTDLNTAAMDKLNNHASKSSEMSNWLKMHLNGGRINNLSQETLIVTQKHFPDSVKEGYIFKFWCLDDKCTEKYDPETTDITGVTDLYAYYTYNVDVFFYENGGTPSQQTKVVIYEESYGTLPEGTKTGYTFAGWFTEEGEIVTEESIVSIASDHTLYAQWIINNYTITFVFDNGTDPMVKGFNFNETIIYPENVVKEGYTFNGWSPKPERMPAENIIVTAQWIEKPSEFVEIVFGKKGLKEEEVREILEVYTKEEFIIEVIEPDEKVGEIKVIIKFVDSSKASEFVRNVNQNKRPEHGFIMRAAPTEYKGSFSFTFSPLLDFIFMLI